MAKEVDHTLHMLAALCLAFIVITAGCPQEPTGTGTTPAVCGNNKCETGESSSTCPDDCPSSGGGTTGGTTGAKTSAPELDISVDQTSMPAKILGQEQVPLTVRLKNKASMTMNDEENQRLTIRNVKVLFYDFGDFLGCAPSSFDFSAIGPGEEREISCMVTAPSRPVIQTIRIRTYYTYDIYVSLPGLNVLSSEEYQRERTSAGVKTASVSGPLSMTLSASKIPVQKDSPLNVAIKINTKATKTGGILEKDQGGIKYHVGILQIQIPELFTVSYTGPFMQSGNTLSTEYVRVLSGERTISFSLLTPDITTPRETFSISATATDFDIYQDQSVKLNVVGME